MFWADLQQAHQRLSSSIVLLGDDPIRFADVTSMTPRVANLRTGKNVTVDLNDAAFGNFRRLPQLGFVNSVGRLFLVSRVPARSQTHGLSRGNTRVSLYDRAFRLGMYSLSDLIESDREGFVAMSDNDYPTFQEAVEVASAAQPIAFSRKYAVIPDDTGLRRLYRKTEAIGVVAADKTVLLTPKSKCFSEDLSEVIPDLRVMEI